MKKRYLIWNNPCQAIYTIMIGLLITGCINVFSASFVSAYNMMDNGLYYLWRYIVFAIIGFGAMSIVRKIGYKRLLNSKFLWGLYIVVLLLLCYVDIKDVSTKGASRWIYLGPISIQPSEFAKLVIIMLSASFLGSLMSKNISVYLHKGMGLRVVFATLLYCALVYKQPDLGTAAIIVALMMGIFIIAGISLKQVWGLSGVGLAGAVIATVVSPYRLKRVKVWFDPWIDERVDGYQMVQSLLAIGSGGLKGTSWGYGSGKFLYLPEAHTDFAFAIFCQENGFIGAFLLIFAFTILAGAFCRIVFCTQDKKGFLLAAGVTFLIIGQAVANMAMVCGILPVIGVPLIFISYGGSSMIISMVAIGLLLSVYDEEVRKREMDAISPETRRNNLHLVKNRG